MICPAELLWAKDAIMHHTLILSIAVVAVTIAVFAASVMRFVGKLLLLGLLLVVLFVWIEPEATGDMLVQGRRVASRVVGHGQRAFTRWAGSGR